MIKINLNRSDLNNFGRQFGATCFIFALVIAMLPITIGAPADIIVACPYIIGVGMIGFGIEVITN